MAWTAFPTWVVGQVSLASDWNTYVAANMNFLAAPPTGRAYASVAQSLSGTPGWGIIELNNITWAANGMSINTGSYVFTVPVPGYYLCTGAVAISLDNNPQLCIAGIGHNSQTSATAQGAGLTIRGGTASDAFTMPVADQVLCAAGDYLCLLAYNGGSNTIATLASSVVTYMSVVLAAGTTSTG